MRTFFLFWLMTEKNLLVMWRSRIWTILEIILPLLIGIPISILIFKNPDYINDNDKSNITSDIVYPIFEGGGDSIYSVMEGVKKGDAQRLIQTLCQHLKDQRQNCEWKFYPNPNDLLDFMQGENQNSYIQQALVINRIDFSKRILDYEIYIYDWYLNDGITATWTNNDPYRWIGKYTYSVWQTWDRDRIQFEHSLNSAFINLTNLPSLPPVQVEGLTWTRIKYRDWMDIFTFYHAIIASLVMPIMIHTGREIATEKENGVKAFLNVMGLSSFTFISSHVFIGWIKGMIVVTASTITPAIRLTSGISSMNLLFFFLPLYLYVLTSMTMAAAVASIFGSSNTTIRVITIIHPLLIFLSALDQTTPSIYNPWLSTVASLNYNGALSRLMLAIQSYLYRNRPLSFGEFFEESGYIFNVGPSMCMFLFDILWMSLIIVAAEYYYKSTDFSFSTFIKRFISKKNKIREGNLDKMKRLENSHEVIDTSGEADIVVEHLIKMWGSTGDFAVQDMNLRARRGEITVLLGHNGAGKSTTFSVICGITPPTSGIVNVNAKRVGYCPQGNALFERLTVMEHLWFFHRIKGATNDWRDEGMQLLETLRMKDKMETKSMALSGGMKRKLCLAMALIGDSRVVMLDEPTAGMDTGARQDVQRMLDREKVNRTILFTTHYMDEAECLGDRIVIMVRGRDVAAGSSQFLKRRFGSGYVLTIVMEDKSLRENSGIQITNEVKLFVPSAELTRFHGKQIEITLPQDDRKAFRDLFTHIEESQNKLGISSFGLSINNLEQVFLRVGEMVEEEEDGVMARKEIFSPDLDEKRSSFDLHIQMGVLLWKRFLYSLRNWPQWIYQLVLPLIIVYLLALLIDWNSIGDVTGNVSDKKHQLSFSQMGVMRLFVTGDSKNSSYSSILTSARKADNLKIEMLNGNDYLNEIISQPLDLPPIGCGIAFIHDLPNLIFNPAAYWPYPVLFNELANAFLSANGGGQISGSYGIVKKSYHSSAGAKSSYSQFEDIAIGMLSVLVFAMLTSPLASFHVIERVTKFLHQQHLTAVPSWILYLASIVYDTITFIIMTTLISIAFYIGGWDEGEMSRIVIIFILYFIASLPTVYLLSSYFSSAPKANSLITIYQTMGAYGSLLIIAIIQGFTSWKPDILAYFLQLIMPSYGLYLGIQYSREIGRQDDPDYQGDSKARSEYVITSILLLVTGICLSLSTFLSRSSKLRYILARRFGKSPLKMKTGDDYDVQKEREIIENHPESFNLKVKDLTKYYRKFSALNQLSFGIKEAECFGLLGVNGAGKTTTFGILTGEIFANSGRALLGNQEINGILAMGYCPQFDAYLTEFSGREVLSILANLYRYKYPKRKAQSILKAVLMEADGDKQLKHCSGGQKRKISVGIALLAKSSLIILDEPTAGIDPKARREIWSLIGLVREVERRAVLLCSHSMDECEALCTRVGILVRGHLRAIGTTQHLKSRFGNSYQLTLVYSNHTQNGEQRVEMVKQEVTASFPGSTMHSDGIQAEILRFTIPRNPEDRWSLIWEKCEMIAERTEAVDYSIAQSTLTQTFLTLSNQNQEP